jgi:nitrate reductase / nitrite oxidoreductase, beta subunit
MMYLPRLCEHCLNPTCVAACPSGAIYKREEDGIVLIDQDKCRGWRMCVSGCPYKKIYYNWSSGKSEKCIFCYPAHRGGQPTVCSETCVGRIRYLGVMLYDADRIEEAASVETSRTSTRPSSTSSSIPNDPAVIAQARADGVPDRTGSRPPSVADLEDGDGVEGRLPAPSRIPHAADGLVRAAAVADPVGGRGRQDRHDGEMPDVRNLRIPVRYLANLLTAGKEEPVALGARAHAGHARLHAGQDRRRRHRRGIAERVGLTGAMIEDMYQIMAIANYEDRFVIPTAHRELGEDAYDLRGSCGFSFGNGCSLATQPNAKAHELLGQPVHILSALAERLRKRKSNYEAVFRALVILAAAKPKDDEVANLLGEPDPDADDLAALDAAWEDEPVQFGPGAAAGCKDDIVTRLRAAGRPAPGMPVQKPKRPIITHNPSNRA